MRVTTDPKEVRVNAILTCILAQSSLSLLLHPGGRSSAIVKLDGFHIYVTADTIVSWPNHKQWVIVHTSDLMMIIRQSIYILSIITTEMGKLKTYSPTYCIIDNGENMLNLTHTHDKIYLTGIL